MEPSSHEHEHEHEHDHLKKKKGNMEVADRREGDGRLEGRLADDGPKSAILAN